MEKRNQRRDNSTKMSLSCSVSLAQAWLCGVTGERALALGKVSFAFVAYLRLLAVFASTAFAH